MDTFLVIKWEHTIVTNEHVSCNRMGTYDCHKWTRICSVCSNNNPILSSFMTYHRNKSNATGTTCGIETARPSCVHIQFLVDSCGSIFNLFKEKKITLVPVKKYNWNIVYFRKCRFDLLFNATFSNISAISWRPVLVVEEAGLPWANNW